MGQDGALSNALENRHESSHNLQSIKILFVQLTFRGTKYN